MEIALLVVVQPKLCQTLFGIQLMMDFVIIQPHTSNTRMLRPYRRTRLIVVHFAKPTKN